MSGQLGVLSAGIVANGEQIKRVPVEVIDANKKLALDTPNQLKSALCEELQNGECFASAMDRWIGNQPLSKVPNQIGALTPIIVNTGSIVNNQNSTITNLGNQVNNQNSAITNLGNQVNNQNTAITNLGNQVNNQTTAINNANNVVNNQNTAINNLGNQVNNQNTTINNLGNQINNQNTAIDNVNNNVNNVNNNVNNQGPSISNINNNVNIIKADFQSLGWIEVEVPTVACIEKEGVWTPEITRITVKVLATKDGNEADQVVNKYQEIAKLNISSCLLKNKEDKEEECECYAAVPDMWLIRPEHHRPQLIFQFGEVVQGRVGSPKYPITIPHPMTGFRPNKNTLPQYQKGNWEIIYVLKDNSRIVLHTFNETIGLQLLEACIAFVDPFYLVDSYLSKNCRVEMDRPLSEIEVAPKMAKMFEEGRKSGKPDWIVKFR
jgi:uncharacterized coiled-coil protein SlyX